MASSSSRLPEPYLNAATSSFTEFLDQLNRDGGSAREFPSGAGAVGHVLEDVTH